MSKFSRPAWLTTGLILGAIAIPAVSVAATATYVSITANGRVAAVSPYGQLRATQMDPGYGVHTFGFAGSGGCTDLGVPSATRAVVVKQVNAGMYDLTTGNDRGVLFLFAGATCTGALVAAQDHSTFDSISSPLDPGVTIPAGTHLSASTVSGSFHVDVYGYQAVPGAIPPATPAQMLRNAGPTINPATARKR